MLIEQNVLVTWDSRNKDYYTNLGYQFTGYRTKFMVKIQDLSSNTSYRVAVKCDHCGAERTIPYYRYCHSVEKYGQYYCNHCSGTQIAKITFHKRQDRLYSQLIDLCKDINYQPLTKKEEIVKNTSRITYVCNNGHKNSMRLSNLLSGKRCPDCHKLECRKKYKNSDEYVKNAIELYGGTWKNYGEYVNRYERNLIISCPSCHKDFTTSFVLFTQHSGQLCPDCSNKMSVGESKIKAYLDEKGILYEREKWFSDCRDINPLPFDFYLPETNEIIEFDGKQHFDETHLFSHTPTSTVKKHDQIKNEYCISHNIHLIRIPYTKINNITQILDQQLIA